MKATSKTSTIRANGVTVTNLTANQTLYSSDKLFLFGVNNREAVKQQNGLFQVIKTDQFAGLVNQPYTITI